MDHQQTIYGTTGNIFVDGSGMVNQKLMLDKNNKLISMGTGNISYYVN